MKATTRLRQLIADPEILLAPGAYDGITAHLIEQAGFSALYMTGAGTSASFGLPDYGLLTMTEMVGNAARITAAAVSLPLIADRADRALPCRQNHAVEVVEPFVGALKAGGNVALTAPLLSAGKEVRFPFWIASGEWARAHGPVVIAHRSARCRSDFHG
jgi:2-methylisocitrate lyase-like PEP mutase family enzyme